MDDNKIKSIQEFVRVLKQDIERVEREIGHIVAGAYVPAGSVYFANLPALSEERVGYVYDIKDDFTTTSDFMEGAGKRYSAGTNVGIVKDNNGNPKYDCFSGLVDTTEIYTEIAKKQNINLSKEIAGSTTVEGSLSGLKSITDNIELDISSLQGSITSLGTAIDGKLGKSEKAASAGSADFATKAVNDGHDNEIAATYLTKTDAASTYLGINAKAASATIADTAGTATNALKDSNNVDINITTIQSSISSVSGSVDSCLTKIGTLQSLTTSEKTNLVGAINEVNTKPSGGGNGKVSTKTVSPQLNNDRLVSKSWSGLSNPNPYYIWTDGKDIFYSYDSDQFVLDVDTGTWSPKIWNGDWPDVEGDLIWTDGENIYASISGDTVELDRDTSTWSLKEWSDGRHIDSTYSIWTDGEDIYYKNTHMLDKANDRWNSKSFSGITRFNAQHVWNDGKNTYYSNGNEQYVLDKANNAWVPKVWGGLNNFEGGYVWTDGEDIYYSGGSVLDHQYVLDKTSDTWVPKTWYGLVSDSDLIGNSIWTDGKDIYFSAANITYKFDIKKPKSTKLH